MINITNVIFKLNLVSAHSKYKKKIFWFALSVYQRFFLILNYLYIVTLLLLHSFFSYISYIKSFNITCIKKFNWMYNIVILVIFIFVIFLFYVKFISYFKFLNNFLYIRFQKINHFKRQKIFFCKLMMIIK